MNYDAVSRNEQADQLYPQPLHAGERGGPPGPPDPEAADESGEHLEDKPVTMAIHEVAEGKLDARNMDLTIEE